MNFLADAKKKKKISEYLYAVAGCLIYSIGFNMLIVPMGLYSGGFMGISQLADLAVKNLLGVTIPEAFNFVGVLYFLINVPLFYLAYKVMTKEYAFKSLIAVVVLTITLMIVPIPRVPFVADYLTASIIGGIVAGVGGGFILRGRMAGGGQDIIGVCCAKKFPDFSVGKV
ncbi:MAG: YitT family protein, partial [Dorea sp.]